MGGRLPPRAGPDLRLRLAECNQARPAVRVGRHRLMVRAAGLKATVFSIFLGCRNQFAAVKQNALANGRVMPQESNVIPGLMAYEPLNILFVSHDAHPMGAQNLLLTLTSWLKENGLVNPRFVLAGPGALTDDFLRVGPVLRWDSDERRKSTPDATVRLLRSFCGKD